jgi:hypothetical protein
MKNSRNKPTKAGAVELTEDELGQVAGGLVVKMEDVLITSYSISGHGADSQPDDADLTNPELKR